jgi:hypothetical protein
MDILRQDGWKARICGKIRGAPCSWQRSSDMNHSCDKLQKTGVGFGAKASIRGEHYRRPLRASARTSRSRPWRGIACVICSNIRDISPTLQHSLARRALWAMAQANSGDHAASVVGHGTSKLRRPRGSKFIRGQRGDWWGRAEFGEGGTHFNTGHIHHGEGKRDGANGRSRIKVRTNEQGGPVRQWRVAKCLMLKYFVCVFDGFGVVKARPLFGREGGEMRNNRNSAAIAYAWGATYFQSSEILDCLI